MLSQSRWLESVFSYAGKYVAAAGNQGLTPFYFAAAILSQTQSRMTADIVFRILLEPKMASSTNVLLYASVCGNAAEQQSTPQDTLP